ncbi:hypothetical protein CANARDRAFT_203478 [[Candida] arabinofermentans NRRL YB-2248]|uniref:Uncharacterized protein n=1 Tax=[Candida] arabinofermentans NRRL YB-2248 TaxID=983967 RepID=A0A1E4SV15_9ASCO|nr:hypothetical protein CANARDRAFT_203478 [[Candida] arabinofermentans NRRL YB-2248]
MELKIKNILIIIINLESIIKKLIKNFEKNKLTLVELGGFFNIFSILEEQHQKIESFGNKIDLTFLNIELLIKSITIKILEPLMILRLTLISMIQLLNFRKLKELQLTYLQEIILKKQSRMKSIIERLISEYKLNEVLMENNINSPSVNKALNELKLKRSKYGKLSDSSMIIINDNEQEDDDDELFIRNYDNLQTGNSQNNWKTVIAGTSKSITSNKTSYSNSNYNKSISKLSLIELNSEINKIKLELNEKLIPCFNNLLNDVKFISLQIENNLNIELNKIILKLNSIINDWKNDVCGEFAISCMNIWKSDK